MGRFVVTKGARIETGIVLARLPSGGGGRIFRAMWEELSSEDV
jgi:hypothetical protein